MPRTADARCRRRRTARRLCTGSDGRTSLAARPSGTVRAWPDGLRRRSKVASASAVRRRCTARARCRRRTGRPTHVGASRATAAASEIARAADHGHRRGRPRRRRRRTRRRRRRRGRGRLRWPMVTSSTASTRPSPRRRRHRRRGPGCSGMRSPRNSSRPPDGGDEAHVLAVGLGRRAQPEPQPRGAARRPWSCRRPGTGTGPARRWPSMYEHVGLVLGRVGAPRRRDASPSLVRRPARGGRWRPRRSRARRPAAASGRT